MNVGSVGERRARLGLRKTWVLESVCVSDGECLRQGDFCEQRLRGMKGQKGRTGKSRQQVGAEHLGKKS